MLGVLSYLGFFGAANAALLAGVDASLPRQNSAGAWLRAWLICLSLATATILIGHGAAGDFEVLLGVLEYCATLAAGPCLYFYARCSAGKTLLASSRSWHLLPALLSPIALPVGPGIDLMSYVAAHQGVYSLLAFWTLSRKEGLSLSIWVPVIGMGILHVGQILRIVGG